MAQEDSFPDSRDHLHGPEEFRHYRDNLTSVQREDEFFALITIHVDAQGDPQLLRRVYATLSANCTRAVFRSGEDVFSVGFLTRDPNEGQEAAERMKQAIEREKNPARFEFTTKNLGRA